MSKKLSKEEFICRAELIHGKRYKYHLVEYKEYNSNIIIVCKIHGHFIQSASNHLQGKGCQICRIDKLHKLFRKPSDKFMLEARNIHGNRYDYSFVEYKNNRTKVKIICLLHGEFNQNPYEHIQGSGCPICKSETLSNIFRKPLIEFINTAVKIHNNRYDYSRAVYINSKKRIEIICLIHGSFYQSPYVHISGCGCPKCHMTRGEKTIENILQEKNIKYFYQYKIKECIYKAPLVFDFYLPDHNILIEYNGEQHYKRNKYFHKSENDFQKQIKKDSIKIDFVERSNKFKLVTIPYWSINGIRELVGNGY